MEKSVIESHNSHLLFHLLLVHLFRWYNLARTPYFDIVNVFTCKFL